jgi:hypothetical protein
LTIEDLPDNVRALLMLHGVCLQAISLAQGRKADARRAVGFPGFTLGRGGLF